ncbi:hypothetical protein RTBOTA2_002956 [Rhodotorula toruloides]|nr:hypothetical protein RTBOTA2_002956 [Rhodotorula toruloides]
MSALNTSASPHPDFKPPHVDAAPSVYLEQVDYRARVIRAPSV